MWTYTPARPYAELTPAGASAWIAGVTTHDVLVAVKDGSADEMRAVIEALIARDERKAARKAARAA